jgi:hypothetical protein
MPTATKAPSILVKRYPGSRPYDTTNRRYVALAQLRHWTAEGIAFAVIDAATGAGLDPRPAGLTTAPANPRLPLSSATLSVIVYQASRLPLASHSKYDPFP